MNSTTEMTTEVPSEHDMWENVSPPPSVFNYHSDNNTTDPDNITSFHEANHTSHLKNWEEYFQNKSKKNPKYYRYLISEYESDM